MFPSATTHEMRPLLEMCCFSQENDLFLDPKMPVLWGIYEDRCFWDLEWHFGDFRRWGVLWGFLETVPWPNMRLIPGVEDSLKLFWGSPKPPRNPGPSAAERHSPPVPFLPAFDASPRGLWGPHPTPPSPEGLFSWYEWPIPFQYGSNSLSFIEIYYLKWWIRTFRGGFITP